MTEKNLKSYRAICREIASLDARIRKEQEKTIGTVAGKVQASMTEFPYTEIHVGVEMAEPRKNDASKKLIRMYQERKERAEKKKLEIEQFIDSIEDPELRLIFQYRFIDGLKQEEIAEKIRVDRSVISRRISGYMRKIAS